MAVVSMSKQEFSRLEVLLRVQSGRLRVSDACALNVSAAAGVSFLLCTPGDISILRRHNQNGLEIQLQPPLLASPPKEPASWGWGGPPKGAGRGGPRRSFAKGHTQGFVCGKPKTFVYHSRLGDPVKMAEAKKLAAAKAEREEQLIQRLGDIALNSENEMAAIAACNGALDRIDGKPVARTRNQSRTTTLEEMIREAAKRGEKPTV
jgi:hypothetical protein